MSELWDKFSVDVICPISSSTFSSTWSSPEEQNIPLVLWYDTDWTKVASPICWRARNCLHETCYMKYISCKWFPHYMTRLKLQNVSWIKSTGDIKPVEILKKGCRANPTNDSRRKHRRHTWNGILHKNIFQVLGSMRSVSKILCGVCPTSIEMVEVGANKNEEKLGETLLSSEHAQSSCIWHT
jgi:hypothetical protein